MRYFSLVALALASTVVAIPTPQDSSNTSPQLAYKEEQGVSPIVDCDYFTDCSITQSQTTTALTAAATTGGSDVTTTSTSGTTAAATTTGEPSPSLSNESSSTGSGETGPSTTAEPSSTGTGETQPSNTPENTSTSATSSVQTYPTGLFPSGNPNPSSTETPTPFGLLPCGDAYYDPSKYTCYKNPNPFLCPIIDGVATLQCGDACYNPSLYSCNSGVLITIGQAASTTGEPAPSGTETSSPSTTSDAGTSTSSSSSFASSTATATATSSSDGATSTDGSSVSGDDTSSSSSSNQKRQETIEVVGSSPNYNWYGTDANGDHINSDGSITPKEGAKRLARGADVAEVKDKREETTVVVGSSPNYNWYGTDANGDHINSDGSITPKEGFRRLSRAVNVADTRDKREETTVVVGSSPNYNWYGTDANGDHINSDGTVTPKDGSRKSRRRSRSLGVCGKFKC
ncbi:MAG: hypothetical protein Q9220_001146 [cf. Caloplaca sp. 1 TL-2023]